MTFSSLSIEYFNDNLVEYSLSKLLNSECFWVNPDNSQLEPCLRGITKKEIETNFSYFSDYFKSVASLHTIGSRRIKAFAEIYGGTGIGSNGGGARCASIQGLHLKGSGANYLVGEKTPRHHAHGTLNIVDATLETIFTGVLNELLPYGTVPVQALIYTGPNTSFHIDHITGKFTPFPGCILIRKSFLRPAHFLPLIDFTPDAKHLNKFPDTRYLIKRNYLQLSGCLGGKPGFYKAMWEFSRKSAAQMAFAQVHGIGHGAISQSNYSLCGRWADLTNASFLPSFENFSVGCGRGVMSFRQEPTIITNIIALMCREFGKCNREFCPPDKTITYYWKEYDRQVEVEICRFFGLEMQCYVTLRKQPDSDVYFALLRKLIFGSSGSVEYRSPSNTDSDVNRLNVIRIVYSTIHDMVVEPTYRETPFIAPSVKQAISKTTKKYAIVLERNHIDIDQHTWFIRFLRALKRVYFSRCFFRDTVEEKMRGYIDEGRIHDFSGIYDYYLHTISWAIIGKNDTASCVCFYDSHTKIDVQISVLNGEWTAHMGKQIISMNSEHAFIEKLAKTSSDPLLKGYFEAVLLSIKV